MSLLGAHGAVMAGSAAALARWNPDDKAAELVLSSLSQVCTRSTSSNNQWRSVRSITSHNSGKRFAQCLINANGGVNGSMMFGVGTAAASLGSFPGSGATSWGLQCNNSPNALTYHNGSNSTGPSAVSVGGSGILAVNFAAGQIWFGDSANGWYGGGNPAAGTGPRYTFTPGTALFLMLGQYSSPMQNTLLNHDGEATVAVPSGFEMWG